MEYGNRVGIMAKRDLRAPVSVRKPKHTKTLQFASEGMAKAAADSLAAAGNVVKLNGRAVYLTIFGETAITKGEIQAAVERNTRSRTFANFSERLAADLAGIV